MSKFLATDFTRERKTSEINDPVKIIIKPSTELIADEYKHDDNENASIQIFKSTRFKGECEKTFVDTMRSLGYQIPEGHFHHFDKSDDVYRTLDRIGEESGDSSMLIIAVFGFCEEDKPNVFKLVLNNEIEFMNIWEKFTSKRCPTLKDRPKVFLLQVQQKRGSYSLFEQDSILPRYRKRFDMPAETDILIAYSRMIDDKSSYLSQFCENIKRHGKMQDIVTLLNYTEEAHPGQPIVLSTLTRKLYVTPSNFRGHHLELTEHSESLQYKTQKAHDLMDKIHEILKSKEEKQEYGRLQEILGDIDDDLGNEEVSPQDSTFEADGPYLIESSNISLNTTNASPSTYLYLQEGFRLATILVSFFSKIIVIIFFLFLYVMYFVMSE